MRHIMRRISRPPDRWIISRFESTAKQIEECMESYRFDIAAQTLQEFVWNEYCDWYVELSKPVLWDDEANPETAAAARFVLLSILEKSLRLIASVYALYH